VTPDTAVKQGHSAKSIAAVGGLLFLALLGFGAVSGRADCPAPLVQVLALDSGFVPRTLTVRAGTTVMWLNEDGLPHTVTSSEGAFASQALKPNEMYSFRFDAPGTYAYFSGFRPEFIGKIVVR
jgi:plastocyanin